MVYGVTEDTRELWHKIKVKCFAYYYADNGYFGSRRQWLSITRNALQCDGLGEGDPFRFEAHNVVIKPWLRRGAHVLVCPPSYRFCNLMKIDRKAWERKVRKALAEHTDRPIRWREKPPQHAPIPLKPDLINCHALVTYSSKAAIEALCFGVPVFVTEPCAASPMGLSDLSKIETPYYPDDRERWCAVLAANQWTHAEVESGRAWAALPHN